MKFKLVATALNVSFSINLTRHISDRLYVLALIDLENITENDSKMYSLRTALKTLNAFKNLVELIFSDLEKSQKTTSSYLIAQENIKNYLFDVNDQIMVKELANALAGLVKYIEDATKLKDYYLDKSIFYLNSVNPYAALESLKNVDVPSDLRFIFKDAKTLFIFKELCNFIYPLLSGRKLSNTHPYLAAKNTLESENFYDLKNSVMGQEILKAIDVVIEFLELK